MLLSEVDTRLTDSPVFRAVIPGQVDYSYFHQTEMQRAVKGIVVDPEISLFVAASIGRGLCQLNPDRQPLVVPSVVSGQDINSVTDGSILSYSFRISAESKQLVLGGQAIGLEAVLTYAKADVNDSQVGEVAARMITISSIAGTQNAVVSTTNRSRSELFYTTNSDSDSLKRILEVKLGIEKSYELLSLFNQIDGQIVAEDVARAMAQIGTDETFVGYLLRKYIDIVNGKRAAANQGLKTNMYMIPQNFIDNVLDLWAA